MDGESNATGGDVGSGGSVDRAGPVSGAAEPKKEAFGGGGSNLGALTPPVGEDRAGALTPPVGEDRAGARWQRRLLPLMGSMIVFLAVAFFAIAIQQMRSMDERISNAPSASLTAATDHLTRAEDARFRALVTLESELNARRYHQANVLLLSRVSKSYLGFVTGIVLALVGATFVLGKLREATTNLQADGKLGKLALSSSSPGLVLSVLGATLMLVTLAQNQEVKVIDASLYLNSAMISAAPPLGAPAPLPPREKSPEELARTAAESFGISIDNGADGGLRR